ncbi:IclR family transcriptional regulator [Haloplanus aerogenes]|uniref:IclR family transcriptional regulator n=1 Tax=Haloplanus aerogenes TaxID=660522 RepID=A0A3M0DSL9_9EURY|nr:IclR family transcriptional regulator [Haloplanus aerogenes]AZH25476.1 IclR family transcriptional regulator [Haloplanus aerogenes]RMB25188.1 IclR family transcriptional regulator [Haloplanus aerogenes]
MPEKHGHRKIKSVDTTCRLVKLLRERGEATVSNLAADLDLAPGTVHTHLATLKDHGLVVQSEDGYRLGPRFLTLGEFVRNHSDLYQAAKEEIEDLADECGECVHLLTEHDGRLVPIYERFGENAVAVEYHNRKREEPVKHLHCTAAGKAILAYTPDDRVAEIIDEVGLPPNTPQTITDCDTLLDELERIRQRGYSVAEEEQLQGLRAVGAPIRGSDGNALGAVAVSGPTGRLKGERFESEIPELVIQTANICEVNYETLDLSEEVL